jgi:hypothetical protein
MHGSCLSIAILLLVVGCGSEGSTEAEPPRTHTKVIEDLFANPGALVERVPAGSSIPGVQAWEIHSRAEGVSAVGVDAMSGKPKVMYVVALAVDGDETRISAWGLAQSADLHVPGDQLPQAIRADMAALDVPATSLTGPSLRPLAGDPLVAQGSAPLYRCSAALKTILGVSTTLLGSVALDGTVLSPFCGPWAAACFAGTVAAGAGAAYTGKWLFSCN